MTGGYDQAVRVWDMRSRSFDAIQTIKLFADSVTTVAVSTRCDAYSTHDYSQRKPPKHHALSAVPRHLESFGTAVSQQGKP